MYMNKAIAAAILAFCASSVIAAPLPQLAGEGSAANSIISQTDNGVGYGTENALDNLAGNVATVKAAVPATPAVRRRQLAGEGSAADSIISQTDNGVGYGTENALDNLAGNVATVKAAVPATPAVRRRQLGGEGAAADSIISDTDNGVGYGTENALDAVAGDITTTKGQLAAAPKVGRRQLGGEGAAADSIISDTDNGVGYGTENALDAVASDITTTKGQVPAARRRQLDKISNGVAAVSNAAGTGSATAAVTNEGDTLDGQLTSGAANAGAQVGDTEASTLEQAGAAVPKFRRQLDKISNGVAAVSNAAGTGAETAAVTNEGDTLDGQLTSGAAAAGAQVGDTEASTLEQAGSAVPKFRRQLDKISNGVATLSNAAGTGATTSSVTTAGDNIDGTLTSGAAAIGADTGTTEENTLEEAGSAVPSNVRRELEILRRQLDKISNGVATLSNAAGTGATTSSVTTAGDNIDGTLTSGAAAIGADTGTTEEDTLEEAGSAVPSNV